jgi:hypothetical protein
VEGLSEGQSGGFVTQRSSESTETVWLKVDQAERKINVTMPTSRSYQSGEGLSFSGPSPNNPVGAVGIALVTTDVLGKTVTVKFRSSAVFTHDESAFPAHFGTYFTPHNNDFIKWLPGGYKESYPGEDEYSSEQTSFISLSFELRCVD